MVALQRPYILGLDLGVQSVGWTMIDLDGKSEPCGIRRMGVRCFDSGVGTENDIASGKDESQNIHRRQARQARRQLWRRGRRLKKLFHLLQKAGLLPPDEAHTTDQRHELLKKLDAELAAKYLSPGDRIAGHLLPYRLRALALDKENTLPPFALGRAIFHLGQRRGFLSNRKSDARSGEELGAVKEGIAQLWESMKAANARTLGEYFSMLDPEQERIRKRWTARQMYLDEFEAIWTAQAVHHPQLNDECKKRLHDAIFRQRPLKSQQGLIGKCELEPDRRRAPRACVEAQRFRYLQKVNDLEISTPDGEIWAMTDPAHADLRQKLIELMETHAEVEFKSLRTKLGLWAKLGAKKPKKVDKDFSFNLEAGGEKRLKGNVTAVKLRNVLGDDYDKLSPEQLTALVEDLLEYEKQDALARRITKRYGIAPAKAEELAAITLEPNYASLSREAMRKLLPLMEQGFRFAEAKKRVYGESAGRATHCDLLPPVLEAVPQLRNPVVCRGLSELRKVVNALVRQYGKPELIRVELARDLKRSRKQREDLTRQNRENEKSRNAARKKIAERLNCAEEAVSNLDILKVRLWEECRGECPYTGNPISLDALVGKQSQFDIEHIIPFSRSLDDSFANKTLCYHEENRSVKRNQTPYEAYASNATRWAEIIGRVKRFIGPLAYAKLRKFQQQTLGEDWAARMLQDTRYMSRLATEYLGLLYGGAIDAEHKRRVQVSAGRMISYLRDEWGLNAILADGDDDDNEKNRGDHRHHAIDAAVIALTDAATVANLSRSAEIAAERGHRLFALDAIKLPWATLLEDLRRETDKINVSYRVNRRVSGSLHEETNYSKPHTFTDKHGKQIEYRHVRKPLQNMSANEVDNIVDDTIRRLVQDKLKQIGGEPKKVFTDPGNLPYLTAGGDENRKIFIKKARIRKNQSVIPLGRGNAVRYVAPGSNHHMEIFALLDKDGKETKWDAVTVSLYEATCRVRAQQHVIQRDHGPNTRFKFSLAGGEYLELDDDRGGRRLVRVTVISGSVVEFRLHNDARPITLLRKTKGGRAGLSLPVNSLRKAHARKVVVDPLGNILPAND
jgi:CRISPR-associated endonuclease Csn1